MIEVNSDLAYTCITSRSASSSATIDVNGEYVVFFLAIFHSVSLSNKKVLGKLLVLSVNTAYTIHVLVSYFFLEWK